MPEDLPAAFRVGDAIREMNEVIAQLDQLEQVVDRLRAQVAKLETVEQELHAQGGA